MKKLSILFVAILVAALAGCAGDTTDPDGSLAVVPTVQLDGASTGRNIVITWGAVDDVDGYKLYFASDGTGTYNEVADVTTTTATHEASGAGTYVVKAYKGEDFSSANSNEASTMPNIVSTTYTIYDKYSAADRHSAFIFGATAGQTGLASDNNFVKDMYAWDEGKGDNNVLLYSGTFGDYSGSQPQYAGNASLFQKPGNVAYCEADGQWSSTSVELLSSDSVIFVKLPYTSGTNAYVKMYGITVVPDPDTNRGTIVSFSYEYQPNTMGLTVFTSATN